MFKKVLSISACLLFIASIAQTAYAQQSITANLKAEPASYSGRCPAKITFKGQITSTKPGKVQYRFIRSDGALAPIQTLDFDRPGTRHVATTWALGGPGFPVRDRWQAIKVVYPRNIESNKAHFRIQCQHQTLLPDLTVESIRLDKNCRVVVQIRNSGRGSVPDHVWTRHHPKSAGIYLYINGQKWGGASIWKFDPRKALKSPGGTATYTSNLKVRGTASITAETDLWNMVRESSENNNKKTSRLTCKGASANDLSVKIANCPKVVKQGQSLQAGFRVYGKSTFPNALKNVSVDIILTSQQRYPSPAPYASYSPNYSDGVLLQGGREHVSFNGAGSISIKLNGNNKIPTNTPAGTYYLGAVIDAGNRVSERNEKNNVSFCKLRVVKKDVAGTTPQTFSTGIIKVPQTYTFDLDRGQVGKGNAADMWFQAETKDLLYITPRNGGQISVGNRSNRGYKGCSAARYTRNRVSLNDIPEGSYVCARTNEGRLSQFRVNKISGGSPKTLTLGYTTWK